MKIWQTIRQWLARVTDLLLPRYCVMCGRHLSESEQGLCTVCSLDLPYTEFRAKRDNPLELLLHGRVPFVRASAFLYYYRKAAVTRLVFSFKYYGAASLAKELGRRMAQDLDGTGFFDGVDGLVPMPLSRRRERQRGYNQSYWLAQGVADVTGLPVLERVVRRVVNNPSQTAVNVLMRWDNVQGIFSLAQGGGELIRHLHLVVIDDIITTGSTLTAFANVLLKEEDVRLSFLALALSSHQRKLVVT